MNEDRRVHAKMDGAEVVRYNRAGKWYVELAADYGRIGLPAERRQIPIREAAELAKVFEARGGKIITRLPGGQAFDRLVER